MARTVRVFVHVAVDEEGTWAVGSDDDELRAAYDRKARELAEERDDGTPPGFLGVQRVMLSFEVPIPVGIELKAIDPRAADASPKVMQIAPAAARVTRPVARKRPKLRGASN